MYGSLSLGPLRLESDLCLQACRHEPDVNHNGWKLIASEVKVLRAEAYSEDPPTIEARSVFMCFYF